MDLEATTTTKVSKTEDELVCRSFDCNTKAISEEARTVDVVMSTSAIDRYEERVLQNWRLETFNKNPVVLWAHMSRELPIGRCDGVRVENGQLIGTIKFASEKANPLAEQCFQLFREKVLNAVSVGFVPHRVTYVEDEDIYELDDNELVELSCTPTPANPEALVRMRQKAIKRVVEKSAPPNNTQRQEPASTLKELGSESPKEKERQMDFEKQIKDLEAKNAELAAKTSTLETQVTQSSKALEEANKALAAEKVIVTTLNERCQTLEKERATQQERADGLAQKAVERDLDELIGTKITPAEKESLVKLSKAAPELYAEHLLAIKARPDMKLLGITVGTDPNLPSTGGTGSDEDEDVTLVPAGGNELDAAIEKDLATN